MKLYINNYIEVIKNNPFLFLIIVVLLAFSFGFWVGVPLFVLLGWFFEITSNIVISIIAMFLFMGLFFSVYFIPMHLKVSKNIAEIISKSIIITFFKIQIVFILVSSFLFAILYFATLQFF